jgi:hypothetical protein
MGLTLVSGGEPAHPYKYSHEAPAGTHLPGQGSRLIGLLAVAPPLAGNEIARHAASSAARVGGVGLGKQI